MELRDYLRIIGKRIWIFLASIIIVVLGCFLFTKMQPVSYEGGFSAYIVVNNSSNSDPLTNDKYFSYDDYYAWQSSTNFADTVVSWLGDPANITEIYAKNNSNINVGGLKNYSKLFTVKKQLPSTVTVSIDAKDKNEVENLLAGAQDFIKDKTADWISRGIIQNTAIDVNDSIIITREPQIFLNSVLGLLAGIIIGLALVFFTDYMTRKK